jgi:quercetin dioxygenase-like cupin family protein
MNIQDVPFNTMDWSNITRTEHEGETGMAYWRTLEIGNIRVRMVEYSAGYKANHWRNRGHVLLVLEGEMTTELSDGRKFPLKAGMSYQVADDVNPHRSYTETGVKLFIVD